LPKSSYESLIKHISQQSIVYTVVFNPAGNMLATGGHGIVLWDVYTGREIMRLEDEERVSPIHAVVFSPNGKILISSGGRAISLWQIEKGQEIKRFDSHEGAIKTIALSPNGEVLASDTGTGGLVLLRNIFTGQILKQFEGHQGEVNAMAFSPDGKFLASCDDEMVHLWNVQTGEKLRRFTHPQKKFNKVYALAFSPEGRQLVSGTWDGSVHLWEVNSGQQQHCFEGNTGSVQCLAFHPQGHVLAAGFSDHKIRLWNLSMAQEILCLEGHAGGINALAFNPNGTLLVSGSEDKTVQLWDMNTGKMVRCLEGHTSPGNSVAYSPNGKLLVSVHGWHRIHLWNMQTGKQRRCLETDEFMAISFNPTGNTLISISSTTLQLWDLKTGKAVNRVPLNLDKPSKPIAVAISPDNKMVAASFEDHSIQLWDLETGHHLKQLQIDDALGPMQLLTFSPDSQRLALASHLILLWDVHTGELVRQIEGRSDGVNPGHDMINALAFSPNGDLIASGIGHNNVYLWDVKSGEFRQHYYGELRGHSAPINTVAFSPHGKTLAAGSDYNVIFLWDVATAKQLACLEGHNYGVSSIAFSPDGKMLASCSWDNTVRLWDLHKRRERLMLIGGARGTWLSCNQQGCTRFDDGTLLTRMNPLNHVEAILPAKGKAGKLELLESPKQLSIAVGELQPFSITVRNSGTESVCWVQVVQTPNSNTPLVLHSPSTLILLAVDKTQKLPLQVSASAAYQHPHGQDTTLNFQIMSAFAKPIVVSIPVSILTPNLTLSQVILLKQDKPVLFMIIRNRVTTRIPHLRLPKIIFKKQNKYILMITFSNNGTLALNQTEFIARIHNKNKIVELERFSRDSIVNGQTVKLVFSVPNKIKINKHSRVSLLARHTKYPIYEWAFPEQPIERHIPPWYQQILQKLRPSP
jgi:WD40 repeat protein